MGGLDCVYHWIQGRITHQRRNGRWREVALVQEAPSIPFEPDGAALLGYPVFMSRTRFTFLDAFLTRIPPENKDHKSGTKHEVRVTYDRSYLHGDHLTHLNSPRT